MGRIVASKTKWVKDYYLRRIAAAIIRKVATGKLVVDLVSFSLSRTAFVATASTSSLPPSSVTSS